MFALSIMYTKARAGYTSSRNKLKVTSDLSADKHARVLCFAAQLGLTAKQGVSTHTPGLPSRHATYEG